MPRSGRSPRAPPSWRRCCSAGLSSASSPSSVCRRALAVVLGQRLVARNRSLVATDGGPCTQVLASDTGNLRALRRSLHHHGDARPRYWASTSCSGLSPTLPATHRDRTLETCRPRLIEAHRRGRPLSPVFRSISANSFSPLSLCRLPPALCSRRPAVYQSSVGELRAAPVILLLAGVARVASTFTTILCTPSRHRDGDPSASSGCRSRDPQLRAAAIWDSRRAWAGVVALVSRFPELFKNEEA